MRPLLDCSRRWRGSARSCGARQAACEARGHFSRRLLPIAARSADDEWFLTAGLILGGCVLDPLVDDLRALAMVTLRQIPRWAVSIYRSRVGQETHPSCSVDLIEKWRFFQCSRAKSSFTIGSRRFLRLPAAICKHGRQNWNNRNALARPWSTKNNLVVRSDAFPYNAPRSVAFKSHASHVCWLPDDSQAELIRARVRRDWPRVTKMRPSLRTWCRAPRQAVAGCSDSSRMRRDQTTIHKVRVFT
jgi:hypothetical protein